ncbi:MAG: phospho-sugar mutase, partial [Planctomycetota bacterium]
RKAVEAVTAELATLAKPIKMTNREDLTNVAAISANNDRTIGESAQGMADYVKDQVQGKPLSCAIAYDTRHRSREFAELCAEIMVASGFKVYFLDGYRSTPELSFAVRYKHCDCGIMITASHNPPSDNAVKVYWSTGGQLLSPHDKDSIRRMQGVTEIRREPFAKALADGRVEYCQEEVDRAFVEAVLRQSHGGPRNLKIIYSPLHGVGASAVCPVLEAAGFNDVEVFGPHATPDPDFPNVPKNVANPENSAVFEIIIERARQVGADLILATDPDCDRLGCAVPKSAAAGAEWATLTGNQIGSLLTDYLLGQRQAAGTLAPSLYVVKTLVTTELMRRIADHYGVQTAGNLLVGFKYIGGEMDDRGPKDFVFGAEESYGFLAGDHVRDKDAAVAALLLSELAASLKAEGRTLYEQLDDLFRRYGVHSESQMNVLMPGEKGMEDMMALMARLRTDPPAEIAGMRVVRSRDYLSQTMLMPGGSPQPFDAPKGDMVIFDLADEGNYVAIRPSGTEPKVKFYMFAFDPPGPSVNLEATKAAQADRRRRMEEDLKEICLGGK